MNKLTTWLIALLAAIGLTWEVESTARAEEYQCTGSVGTELLDNIFVPAGALCVLNGTEAKGTITVGSGATLQASAIKVVGNIQAEGAANVTVNNNSTVGGSIQIKQGSAASISSVRVNGDIQFGDNSGPLVADANIVGGNLQAIKNRGGLTIQNNDIDGNLQCKENNPAPIGTNNQAASFEDQCANLKASPTPTQPGSGSPAPPQPGTPTPTATPTPTSTPVPSGDEECRGSISGQSFENLFVPDGQSCTLNGTRVDGNIKVGTNSTLVASDVSVGGNIQAEGSTNVTVNNDSSVVGSIQIKQGGGATITNVRVNGDIQFDENRSQLLADGNIVGGNLQAFKNRGGLTIRNNNIDGNLQCKENNPAPTGGNNQAASLEDQCAALGGAITPTPPSTGTPGPGTPAPSNGECRGSIGAQSFENLFVPDGQSCTLNGTRIDGNLTVGTGATLQATSIRVGGNIQAEGATSVSVTSNSFVGGSIQIKQGGSATIKNVKVNADIQLDSNSSQIEAINNHVGGNFQAMSNSGGVKVLSNNMDGNLQCKENTPAPTGGNNLAASLEDQCAALSVAAMNFTEKMYLPGIR